MTATLRVLTIVLAMAMLPWPRLAERWTAEQWCRQFLRRALSPSGASVRLGDPPAAVVDAPIWRSRLALAEGNPARALALAEPRASKGDAFALEAEGDALAAQRDFPRALRAYQQAGAVVRLRQLAERAVRQQRFDVAADAYEAAYAKNPAEGILTRAWFLWQEASRAPAAESLLRRALQDHPAATPRASWLRLLADLLRAERRWDDAEAVYARLLDETPGDVDVRLALGWLQYQRGRSLDAVLGQFQRAIDADPARGEGYFAMGLFLAVSGRQADSDAWIARAEARFPDARRWYMVWGERVRQTGDLPLALKIYQAALARHPDDAYAYYEMAWTCRLANQPAAAIGSIERAVALAGPQPEYFFNVRAGRIYEWAGERDRALAAYRAALAAQPANGEAAQGLARLGAPSSN